jgi:hypothetical protein
MTARKPHIPKDQQKKRGPKTGRRPVTTLKQQKFLECYAKHYGHTKDASIETGIPIHMHHSWVAQEPDYKAKVHAIDAQLIEIAKKTIFAAARSGDVDAAKFILSRKAGWTEKQQVDVTVTSAAEIIKLANLQAEKEQQP